MRRLAGAVSALLLVGFAISPSPLTAAQPKNANGLPANAQALSPKEERRWADAVKYHKTADGATVLQVLQFAQKMRSAQFKFGDIGVGYNGASGVPEIVGITYWLGQKRFPDDAIVNLGYDVTKTGDQLSVAPMSWPVSLALEQGRDAFLSAIDDQYKFMCIDGETHRRVC